MQVVCKCLCENGKNEKLKAQINIAKKNFFRRANELFWFFLKRTHRFEFELLLTRKLDLL